MDFVIILGKVAAAILLLLFRFTRGLLRLLWRWVRPRSTTFGSARWAKLSELIRGGVLRGDGIIVGKTWGRFIRFNQQGYVLLFAPTRSGKGVGVVVPNLLNHKGSIICTDPKGENSAITARHRSSRGPVFTLDVIHPELSHRMNPLYAVRAGTYHEADDAQALAKLLIVPEPNGGHWDTRATQFLQALILYTRLRYADVPELCTLAKVRSLVALGASGIQPVIDDAKNLGSATLRETMESFSHMEGSEEAKAIFSNTEKAMNIWGADRPAGVVSAGHDFDFRDFNRAVMTCYMVVDEEKLPIYAGFLRVYMGLALMAMARAKEEAPPKYPTLFLLDEAAAMGRIEPLEAGVGYLATYAWLVMVFQDIDQLKQTYSKAESIIANASCKLLFGVSDLATAKMVAESLGPKTVKSHSAGQSHSSADPFTRQNNQGASEAGRSLLDASEVLRLSRHKAIIFFNGTVTFPVLAGKVRYYRERCWKGLWDRWRAHPDNVVPFTSPAPSSVTEFAA